MQVLKHCDGSAEWRVICEEERDGDEGRFEGRGIRTKYKDVDV